MAYLYNTRFTRQLTDDDWREILRRLGQKCGVFSVDRYSSGTIIKWDEFNSYSPLNHFKSDSFSKSTFATDAGNLYTIQLFIDDFFVDMHNDDKTVNKINAQDWVDIIYPILVDKFSVEEVNSEIMMSYIAEKYELLKFLEQPPEKKYSDKELMEMYKSDPEKAEKIFESQCKEDNLTFRDFLTKLEQIRYIATRFETSEAQNRLAVHLQEVNAQLEIGMGDDFADVYDENIMSVIRQAYEATTSDQLQPIIDIIIQTEQEQMASDIASFKTDKSRTALIYVPTTGIENKSVLNLIKKRNKVKNACEERERDELEEQIDELLEIFDKVYGQGD